MEETVSLEQLFLILKKKVMLILAIIIVGTILTAGITFFVLTPKYNSAAQLIVQDKATNENYGNLQNDISGNVLLINTYKDMIKGDVVIDSVQKKLMDEYHYNYTNSQLKEMIEIVQSENSQMFQIVATAQEPRRAAIIANITAQTFEEKAEDVLAVNKVTITSKGNVPSRAVFPNNKMNLAIGAVISLLVGISAALLLELLNKTVKDERFITETLGLPILGQVSEITKKDLVSKHQMVVSAKHLKKEPSKNISTNTRKRKRV